MHGGASEPIPTTRSRQDANLSAEQRKELKNLLKFDQIHARILSLRTAQKHTCGWIVHCGPFREWIETSRHNGILWIKGKPGAGKSVAMKFLHSEAQKTIGSNILLSFFFNARGSDLEKSTLGLYRSLLFQLLDLEPELGAVLDHNGKPGFDFTTKNGWKEITLKQTLSLALGMLERCRVYCYIDALDECPEDEVRDMIVFFEEIGRPERIRVCFSSRHYPEINVPRALKLILEDEQHHSNDIKVYIDSHLNTPDLPETDTLKKQILHKSSGIFLWVALVIPMLNKASDRGLGNRIEGLMRKLAQIPDNLNDLFLGILKRDQDNVEELRLCIQWILFARRPLTPEELYAAVQIGLGDDPDEGLAPRSEHGVSEILRKRILDISKGLAEITKSDSPTVQFIHESVRDFLLRGHGVDVLDLSQNNEGRSHNYFTEICRLQLGISEKTGNVLLLDYVQDNIIGHANEAQRHGFNQDKFLADFPTQAWLNRQTRLSKSATLLHILALEGAECLISIHPKRLSHFRMGGQNIQFPLVTALGHDHAAAAGVLLGLTETGILDFQTSLLVLCREARGASRLSSPLALLVKGGDALLLRRVFESEEYLEDCRDLYDRDSLLEQAGSEDMVDLLFEFSEALTTQRLPISAQEGIERAANTDTRVNDRQAPEKLKFVAKTLKHRPGLIYDKCWGKGCLLGYALEKSFDNLAKLAGLEVSKGAGKEDALVIAVSSNGDPVTRLSIIKDLFEAGGDLGWVDERGLTLLHHSVQSRSGRLITEFLLSTGKIDLEKKDDLGATALSKAVRACRSSQAKSLVAHGADLHPDGCGPSLLHTAVYESWRTCDVILGIISVKGVDLELKDQHGVTPLYAAVRRQDHLSAKTLVEAGADPMAGAFDTIIFSLVSSALLKDLAMAEALTSSPRCNRNIRDAQGRNLLWHCVASPFGKPRREMRLRIMSNLLDSASVDSNYRVNPNERDENGETALGKAIRLKEVEFVRLLLESGQTDPEFTTSNGSIMQTPFEMTTSLSKETDGRFHDRLGEIGRLLINTGKMASPLESAMSKMSLNLEHGLNSSMEAAYHRP
ncbi:Pfs NB-ARC and Ankyrin domain [Fusarium albosuccineum]|uniref:Pfs NB-ARC and Ankyrin domain n=1 Tax=Fusarium albosuccineum TaxID=1237068 RepID=A0A8H4PHX3_9HYPO|nr:Pfs NB-ARC and Ankyrin domain [Fusarium albosuccineum]